MLFLFGMSFTGKPTYEQILMKAKSGKLPALVDSGDLGSTPAGLYYVYLLSYWNAKRKVFKFSHFVISLGLVFY